MNNIIPFKRPDPPAVIEAEYRELQPTRRRRDDEADRIEATKGLAKEAWPMLLFPFTTFGALFSLKGAVAGFTMSLFFYCWLLLTMRYGKEM